MQRWKLIGLSVAVIALAFALGAGMGRWAARSGPLLGPRNLQAAQTQPAQTRPAQTQPSQTQPAQTQSAQTQPVRQAEVTGEPPLKRESWLVTATHAAAGHPATNLLDGDPTTLWTTGEGMAPGMALTVDLGKAERIDRAVLRLPVEKKDDRARILEVATSQDGKTWEVIHGAVVRIPQDKALWGTVVTFPPRTIRHLRLTQTAKTEAALADCGHGAFWWSAGELELYGSSP